MIVTLPQPTAPRRLSRLAFRRRFTLAEREDIEIAAIDVPAAPPATRRAAARLRVQQQDLFAAESVDLDDPELRAGVQALEASGLLAAGRAHQILGAPVTDGERA